MQTIEELKKKARAAKSKRKKLAGLKCEDFVEYAFLNEQDGTKLRNQEFHREWHQLARAHDKLIIRAAVEHGKTISLGIATPLFMLGRNHSLRIAIIQNTQTQAEKSLRSIRQHIIENPRVQEIFPTLKPSTRGGDPWHNTAITVERDIISKDPSIQVCGCDTGSIVGSRLDLIILDDVLDFENTRTPERRKKLLEWFETSVFTRLTPGGKILVIGTPWHREDIMAILEARPGFRVETYSAVKNPDDQPEQWEPMWPQQWPLTRLLDRQQNMSEHVFLRKYLCRVRVDSAGRFRAVWIERMNKAGQGRQFTLAPPKAQGGERRLLCFTGVDLGVGKKEANARTCIHTLAVDDRHRKLIVNIESGHWTAPEILDRLHRNYLAYNSIIHVENNAAQDFLVQIAEQIFPVQGVHTGGHNKNHEEYGVEAMAVDIRNGQWVMPSGLSGQDVPDEGKSLISELLHYDPDAHTGDRVMAMWIASEAARKFGVPRGFNHQMQDR